jgi:hypothetical protein
MAAGIDREELRALVRQALKESLGPAIAVAPVVDQGLAADLRAALARGKPAKVPVAAGTGADLDRFARGIAEACGDAEIKAAIVGGDVRFEPVQAAQPGKPAAAKAAPTQVPAKGGAFEMTSGVLSEVKLVEISRTHSKILIGSDVVMTPLARDKARAMKVELVRQKP